MSLDMSEMRHRSPSAIWTCAITGARLPTSRARMASGEPALTFASPGVTSRPIRAGKSVSEAASAACRAGPRAANRTRPSAIAAAAAWKPARRSAAAGTIVSMSMAAVRRAASASIAFAKAGAVFVCATSTAETSRSSSDGARSSM